MIGIILNHRDCCGQVAIFFSEQDDNRVKLYGSDVRKDTVVVVEQYRDAAKPVAKYKRVVDVSLFDLEVFKDRFEG